MIGEAATDRLTGYPRMFSSGMDRNRYIIHRTMLKMF